MFYLADNVMIILFCCDLWENYLCMRNL